MNLCRPDHRASCAACCGLYNVPNATRPYLLEKLRNRTLLFAAVPRTPDALLDFQASVLRMEDEKPLDPVIHVCEFTGFVDPEEKIVGCLLHPSGSGNEGIDLRGLCHYGSMACKTFFCPSWEEVPRRYLETAGQALDDWHLYGLVMTDTVFLRAVFGMLEHALGQLVNASMFAREPAKGMLREILAWKDAWPPGRASLKRRNRYHITLRRSVDLPAPLEPGQVADVLDFTFDVKSDRQAAMDKISRHTSALASVLDMSE